MSYEKDDKSVKILYLIEQDELNGQRLRRRAFSIGASYGLNEDELADQFQEMCLTALLKGDQVNAEIRDPINLFGNPDIEKWLIVTYRNNCIDYVSRERRKRREIQYERGNPLTGNFVDFEKYGKDLHQVSEVERKEEEAKLKEVFSGYLDRLKEIYREALILFYYQGLKVREIASQLDIPIGTVKRRLHVARKRLEMFLREDPIVLELHG